MILLIDNYDSFVHNLARHLRRLGQETRVVRNDAIDVSAIRKLDPAAIVISPGPGTPSEAGCSLDVVRELQRDLPILGVCLGHQTIGQALGGRIVRASEPLHGRASQIEHNQRGLFAAVPTPFTACRYHSLVIEEASLPAELEITARALDGTIMAIAHRELPLLGVQFHPEAVLTQHGYLLLANFLRLAGLSAPRDLPTDELPPVAAPFLPPGVPVTF
ncbi:MAG TPA: aminodeoxychorismate/anthranilate synthase component II [Pirellulaceae bacterium]|nr:aminodeoxychorismate/anthranilate synthase component II [Pirellulaceae bacterium]